MSVRDEIVANAREWLGTMYRWGGESRAEGGVDCSGLIIAAFRDAGRPGAVGGPGARPIASQLGTMGIERKSLAEALPADVIYIDNPGPTDHVGLYIGNGQMIEAPYEGQPVRISPVRNFTSIRSLLGGTVTGADTDAAGPLGTVENALEGLAGNALSTGVKLAVTAGALALLVVGAKSAVSSN
jgi:peptidoglycan DL-endopeptidase CwlO